MFNKLKNISSSLVVFLFFTLICLIFFWPFFKNGKVPIALDIPTGMYYPWLNENYGFPVKVPVKNPILTDTISQFWIWRNWAVEGLKTGQIKIWNPYSFSGYELSPWFHSMLFSPLNIFYFVTDRLNAMSLIILFQLIISFFGSFYLGLKLVGSKISAVYFSLAWSLSSYFLGWLTWGSISLGLAVAPIVILFTLKIFENQNSLSSKLWLFISFVALHLSGHPQTIAYSLFLIFSFAVYETISTKKYSSLLIFFILFLLSLIFISPVLLPSFTIIKNSIRSLDNQLLSVNYGLIKWSDFLSLLFSPNFFGNPATGNYYGGGYNYQEKLTFFGVIPLYFFFVSLFSLSWSNFFKNRLQVLGVFFALFGLLIAIDNPIGKLVYSLHLPILSSSPAGRGIIIFIFGAILLSLSSFASLEKRKTTFINYLYGFIALIFAYVFALGVIHFAATFISRSPDSLRDAYSTIQNNYTVTMRNLLPSIVALIGAFFLSIFYFYFKKFSKIPLFFVCLLLVGESFLFFKKYTPFVPKSLYFPETKTTNFLKERQSSLGYFRVERQSAEILPPNMWEAYQLYSASGYDPMANKAYQDYLINQKVISNHTRYIELGEQLSKVNLLGVKYFLVLKRDASGILSEKGSLPYFVDTKIWQEVLTEGPVSILENTKFTPPYQLVSTGSAVLVDFKDNQLSFLVSSQTPNTLTFYQNHSPSWKIKNNNDSYSLTKNKDGFIEVSFPEGTNIVTLFYDNQNFKVGLFFSVVSVLLLFFVIRRSKS